MGLGQSHLSQKIPAATTRCVYLDHLLSVPSTWGSVLLVFVSYKGVAQVLFPSDKMRCLRRSKARLALRSRMASRERLQADYYAVATIAERSTKERFEAGFITESGRNHLEPVSTPA